MRQPLHVDRFRVQSLIGFSAVGIGLYGLRQRKPREAQRVARRCLKQRLLVADHVHLRNRLCWDVCASELFEHAHSCLVFIHRLWSE